MLKGLNPKGSLPTLLIPLLSHVPAMSILKPPRPQHRYTTHNQVSTNLSLQTQHKYTKSGDFRWGLIGLLWQGYLWVTKNQDGRPIMQNSQQITKTSIFPTDVFWLESTSFW